MESRLAKLIPFKLQLENLDGENTPTVLSGVEKSGILVYSEEWMKNATQQTIRVGPSKALRALSAPQFKRNVQKEFLQPSHMKCIAFETIINRDIDYEKNCCCWLEYTERPKTRLRAGGLSPYSPSLTAYRYPWNLAVAPLECRATQPESCDILREGV